MDSIALAAMAKMDELDPLGLSNLVWAFAKLELENRPLLAAISKAAIAKIASFSAQNLANTAWSLAKLGVPDRPLLEAIAAQVVPKLAEFTAFDLSILVWAFDALNLGDLLDIILPSALGHFAKELELEGDVGMFWFDVANVASARASPELRADFERKFEEKLLCPVRERLGDLSDAGSATPHSEAFARWQSVVDTWNIPYLGPEYTNLVLSGLGVQTQR
mmetsp:Transcript_37657/g.60731  ORF Transcript_37657/g.60731 Transcript_37657/m.60731 type:complete len:220 (-) Transcript_37657:16-675(-)